MFYELRADGVANRVYYTSHFGKLVDRLEKRDRNGLRKIMAWLNKLTGRFPNQPEMWERIKRCTDVELFELKPRPYRVAVLVKGNVCLCVYLWKVEKGGGKKKEAEIEKACEKAREVYDEFISFVEGLQKRP